MKRQTTNVNQLICFIILIAICFMYVLMGELFAQPLHKRSLSKVLDNGLIINCYFYDESVSKGTAVAIGDNTIVSVAHLFPEGKSIDSIECTNKSGNKFLATIEKIEYDMDICILTSERKFVKIDIETQCDFGDQVFKIGNSLGYGLSYDKGVVSCPLKLITMEYNTREMLQISMQIYSGDSGAPVFTEDGKLLGIISFKTSTSISSKAELSFAIPLKSFLQFI